MALNLFFSFVHVVSFIGTYGHWCVVVVDAILFTGLLLIRIFLSNLAKHLVIYKLYSTEYFKEIYVFLKSICVLCTTKKYVLISRRRTAKTVVKTK